MRPLFYTLLLLSSASLLGQASQFVFERDLSQISQIIVDEVSGDFYLHGYSDSPSKYNSGLYGYSSDGTEKWAIPFTTFFDQSRNPNASQLIDLTDTTLLYIGIPGEFCLAPVFSSVILIDKTSGEGLSFFGFKDLPFFGANDTIRYSVNEPGSAVIFRSQASLYRINIIDEVLSSEFLNDIPPDQHPIYWQGDSILYIVEENDAPLLRIHDLSTSVLTDIPLPTEYGAQQALAVNGRILIVSSPAEIYSFDPADGSFGPPVSISFTNYKIKGDGIIFHDREQNSYAKYTSADDLFSPFLSYEDNGCTVNDLDFSETDHYLVGSQQLGEIDDVNPFAFWFKGEGSIPNLNSPYEVALINLTLDTVLTIFETLPDPPNNPGWIVAKTVFTVNIQNQGIDSLKSVSIEFPRDWLVNCSNERSSVFHFQLPDLLTGESFTLSDTVFLRFPYESSNTYDIIGEACIGRPNESLELTYANNSAISNSLLLVSTKDFSFNQPQPLDVFPNPSNGLWTISDLPDGPTQWQLYDLNGRRVASGTWLAGLSQQRLELRALASGLYFLTARGEAGVYQAKLMKH